MLFTIDIGNTSIKFGVFKDDKPIAFDHILNYGSDIKADIMRFLYKNGINESYITDSILCCVVKNIEQDIIDVLTMIFNKKPHVISSKNNYGISYDLDNNNELGNDLIVLASYFTSKYSGKNIVFLSLGSCSVISYINANKQFKYAIISPGFLRYKSLLDSIPALNTKKLRKINNYLGKNTQDAISIGVINGYCDMLNSLVANFINDIGQSVKVVACGGAGKAIYTYINKIEYYHPDALTLGLNFIYRTYINV